MESKNRLAAALAAAAGVVVTALLWGAASPAQADHRSGHDGAKPSASPKPHRSPTPTPTPTETVTPTASPSASPAALPVACGGVLVVYGASHECRFTYGGGELVVDATSQVVTLDCGFFYCGPAPAYTGVSLRLVDGTLLASCHIPDFVPACTSIAPPPGVPVGTPLVCQGWSVGTGTFSCSSAPRR